MKILKIGLIIPLSGKTAIMGEGVSKSIYFISNRRKADLNDAQIELEFIEKDDEGDSAKSLKMAEECFDAGVACIIGPCDTACAYGVVSSNSFDESPILSPLATATFLTNISKKNFFRVTSPDSYRADCLVGCINKMYPGKCIHLLVLKDSEYSYSQQLKLDVISALENYKCKWKMYEYRSFDEIDFKGKTKEPILFCSPSSETAKFAASLGKKIIKPPMFTFGSNTNLLKHDLSGAIVIADIDRHDTNAIIKDELEHFAEIYGHSANPQISAMNCINIIINLLIRKKSEICSADIVNIRKIILSDLLTNPQDAFLGKVIFANNGEMIGTEHLSILKISSGLRVLSFKHLNKLKKPLVRNRLNIKVLIMIFAAFIGLISGIITIINFFFNS